MIPSLQVLSQDEIYQIHCAAFEMLEKLGLEVLNDEALKYYEQGGARVNKDKKTVHIPAWLIHETLNKCSPMISIYNSDGTRAMNVGGDNVYIGTVGYATEHLDWRTGEVRHCTLADYEEITKLGEVLEYPQFIDPTGQPVDCPPEIGDLYQAKIALLTTRKPLSPQSYNFKNAEAIINMAAECVGGLAQLQAKPNLVMMLTITSPLVVRDDAAQTILACAKYKIPIIMESGPMAGATSPVTLASVVTLTVAEVLAHMVLAKIVNPEAPIVFGSWGRIFDMKFANVSFGSPEFGLIRAAVAQMAKFYKLPCGGGGCLTDSNSIDIQLGWEKMSTALVPALARMNMIYGIGVIGQENTQSLESVLIDSEVARSVMRIIEGIKVDEYHIAYDVIEEVGPAGTTFIKHPHTKSNYRKEHMIPMITDRSVPSEWVKNGQKNTTTIAKEMIEAHLNSWKRPQLPENIDDTLDAIIKGVK